jgi:hypothetical protein
MQDKRGRKSQQIFYFRENDNDLYVVGVGEELEQTLEQ